MGTLSDIRADHPLYHGRLRARSRDWPRSRLGHGSSTREELDVYTAQASLVWHRLAHAERQRRPEMMTPEPEAALTHQSADASPTKAFFVRMLTRDISLDDCILDLIDNSIDSAWQQAGTRPTAFAPGNLLSDFRVDISYDEQSFSIADNCGGISLDNAAEYAFTFGRKGDPHQAAQDAGDPAASDYSVGVYGIGMKRAIFKIGNDITITSTYAEGDEVDAFMVPISVPTWLADDKAHWDFDIEPAEALAEPGVAIKVRDLNEESRRRFSDPTYGHDLINDVLRRDYLLPLMQGLAITVNGDPVRYRPISLLSNENFSPLRETYTDGDVTVEIIAGMHAPPPDDNEPDTSRQDKNSGWYIVCNGRVVLAADRGASTGWGVKGFPRWHGQYSGFLGVVLFSAADPSLLPMTTTKRNVDVSSGVYQRAANRMLKPTRAWIDYTNARKSALDKAKQLEDSAKPVDAPNIAPSSTVRLPKISATRARVANVNYAVPLAKMKALSSALRDVGSYREVGLASFDFTYDAHVDDEE